MGIQSLHGGVPKFWYLVGVPIINKKDSSILGSKLGSPYFGKLITNISFLHEKEFPIPSYPQQD